MIVSPDNLRMIDGKYVFNRETEGEVWKQTYKQFYDCLIEGDFVFLLIGAPGSGKSTWLKNNENPMDVYFDATNTKLEERRVLLTLAAVLGRTVTGVIFDTPLSTCLVRNASRSEDRRIPEAIIAQMYLNLYNHHPTMREGFTSLIDQDGKSYPTSPI